MRHNYLLDALEQYELNWLRGLDQKFSEPKATWETFKAFVSNHADCFERSKLEGHVTGAALITTPQWDKVLLTHHKKLGLWLQLGGHSDGDPNTYEVSLKEAQEESGLEHFNFVPLSLAFGNPSDKPAILDLDIHSIPARSGPKVEPQHWHYDVRYLLIASEPEKIKISEESHDLRWFSLPEAYQVTKERSMHRQFEKLEFLKTFAQKIR